MGKETKIERDFVRWVEDELGYLAVKLHVVGRVGWPDRMILFPKGHTVFAEFKAPGKEAEPHQSVVHYDLIELDFPVYVWDDLEEAKADLICYLNQMKIN